MSEAEKGTDIERRLEAALAALAPHAPSDQIPGLVVGFDDGARRRVEALGFMDLERARPMPRDAIFRIASLTKPVSAVAALMLAEEGAFTLDEPVDRLLPELADRRVLRQVDGPVDDTVPADRPILISDLLTCRMGLGMLFGLPQGAPKPPVLDLMAELGFAVTPNAPPFDSTDAYLAAMAEMPLMRQPGEAWLYDTSITVLGALIERAADATLPEFYRRRIFAPLGMSDTGFHVPAEKLDRLPPSYRSDRKIGFVRVADPGGAQSRYAAPPGFATAAAGLVSTVEDYLAFCRAMAARGAYPGGRLISEASYAAMTTDRITLEQKARSPFSRGFWESHGWGYGVAIRTAREPGDAHGIGWDGGRGTTAGWDPALGLSLALFTQRMMDGPATPALFKQFWSAARADLFA